MHASRHQSTKGISILHYSSFASPIRFRNDLNSTLTRALSIASRHMRERWLYPAPLRCRPSKATKSLRRCRKYRSGPGFTATLTSPHIRTYCEIKALRWRFFRLHFQYLCAFDRPKDYDYFQITAGPLTLTDRYRNRAPSRSRIDVTASKYSNTAP